METRLHGASALYGEHRLGRGIRVEALYVRNWEQQFFTLADVAVRRPKALDFGFGCIPC